MIAFASVTCALLLLKMYGLSAVSLTVLHVIAVVIAVDRRKYSSGEMKIY